MTSPNVFTRPGLKGDVQKGCFAVAVASGPDIRIEALWSEIMRVYHLVNREYGLENLRLRRLKIAEIDDLNDPFELRSISSDDKGVRRAVDETRSRLAVNRGLLCFSSNWSNPVLWSHYGDKHRGIALGFDIPQEWLVRMKYIRDRATYDPDAMKRGGADADAQMRALLTTKFSHWRYEKEWRAFLSLDARDAVSRLHFINFSDDIQLREVIVGAFSTVSRRELAEALAVLAPAVATQKARLAFKSFKVVRQRNRALWT